MQALRSSLIAATAVFLGAFACVGAAHADPSSELASSPAQRCLSPAVNNRVKPVYPPQMYELKRGATIEAEFLFDGPNARPRVRIEPDPGEAFEDAIKAYAKQLRVPCMGADEPTVKLQQTFVFVPNDGRKVAWTTPRDEANPDRESRVKCIVQPDSSQLRYPDDMLRKALEGRVVVRVHFFDPARSPTFEVLSDGGSASFGRAVVPFLDGLRMPCVGTDPVEMNYFFHFRLDGPGGHYRQRVLKDVSLATFLASVKPIPPDSVYFDTTTMKCPFDVRLTFRQPFEPNKISELEEDVPARHPLLDWMGQREFDLDVKNSAELLGQDMVIHVPCIRIDL